MMNILFLASDVLKSLSVRRYKSSACLCSLILSFSSPSLKLAIASRNLAFVSRAEAISLTAIG